MNFALSQRRTDRHPVGLVIVAGLHVLLAAALLSARLHAPQSEPPPVVLEPLKPVEKVEVRTTDLPQPKERVLKFSVPVPDVVVDRQEPTLVAPRDDGQRVEPPVVVARVDPPAAPPPHAAARPTRLDAGAASCRPAYPAAAQRAGATGVSRIRFTVDALGRIVSAQVLQSSGATREHRLMDKAAADALAQCPVAAGTDESGRPVGGTADVDYVWSLN